MLFSFVKLFAMFGTWKHQVNSGWHDLKMYTLSLLFAFSLIPEIKLQFTGNTPKLTISGGVKPRGELYIEFFHSEHANLLYTCTVQQRAPRRDEVIHTCKGGNFTVADLNPGRYVIQITLNNLNSAETLTIKNQIRVPERLNSCQPYFINNGVTTVGQDVTMDWSSTGNPAGFVCKLDGDQLGSCKCVCRASDSQYRVQPYPLASQAFDT